LTAAWVCTPGTFRAVFELSTHPRVPIYTLIPQYSGPTLGKGMMPFISSLRIVPTFQHPFPLIKVRFKDRLAYCCISSQQIVPTFQHAFPLMKVRAQNTRSFRALILSSFPLSLSDPFELDGNSVHGIVPARTRGAQTKRVPSAALRG
jgi:hypothetical protein